MYKNVLFILTVLALASTASARITYVDAAEGDPNDPFVGNTTLADGSLFTSTGDQSGSDNLWRGRNFANDGTIFESGGQFGDTSNPEDCPRLATTVEVPEGDYAVYAYFWADGGPWRIQASLTNDDNDLPLYFANDPNSDVPMAEAADFHEPVPLLAEGNRFLWQAFLGYSGQTTSITVYIDDDPNHQTHNGRTWYDGIGYEVAPPRITYVDAAEGDPNDGTVGNTTLADGSLFTSTADQSGSDNLWRGRNFANDGTIFESGGQFGDTSNPEDCPRLATSVEVPENVYAVYAYLWADGGPWRIQASLTNDDNDLPLYFANDPNSDVPMAVATDFADPVPLLAEGNRNLWQVFLGYTEMTTVITVFIDDDPNHQTHNGRTWYDGIGYKIAPPRIIYVDAAEGDPNDPSVGNTTLADGSLFTSTGDQSGSDNLWRGRNFANDGTIFESGGQFGDTSNPEDCPRLATTIEVPMGDYAVYAYMWADGSPWRIQASLTNDDGDLPLYFANDPNSEALLSVASDFEAPVPLLAEGNRNLWQVFLGYADQTSIITVYIDDDPNHMTHNGRTWYDGIGYRPED